MRAQSFTAHALVALCLLIWQETLPAQTAPSPPPGTKILGATSRPTPPAPQPAGQMQLRVYEGFNTLGPIYDARGSGSSGRRNDDTQLGIDVAVGLVECADGNTRIDAMNIGGWRYDVAQACSDTSPRGAVGVKTAPRTGDASSQPDASRDEKAIIARTARPREDDTADSAGAPTVIRCNPATWGCSATPHGTSQTTPAP